METSDILDMPAESLKKANPIYAIIPAKSSRAKCQSCSEFTSHGEYVIYKTFEGQSHPMSHYYCLDCFFTKVMPKARNWGISVDDTTGNSLKCIGSCDQLVGFDELDETTKANVLEMINTGNDKKTKSIPASKKTKKQEKVNDILSDVTINDAIKVSKSVAKPKSKATKRKVPMVVTEEREQDDDAKEKSKGVTKRAKNENGSAQTATGNGKVKKGVVDEPVDPSLRRSSRLRD